MGDETLLERILSGDEDPRDLPLALLQSITNDFSDDRKIGQGGFGAVYKGELQNGIIVAVKRIEVNQITIDDVSFRREFNSLMNTNHQNVVRFLGFCSNTHHIPRKEAGQINLVNVRERLLCFEYIRNGSLDKHITDELRGLEWESRYAIISGICKGLFYLHKEKEIVHMDLKPPNILLDDHMVPKIIDFGLSRSNEMSHTTGQRFGTPGYVAPEYEKDGKTSFKCDIYSLGVIITELVTGRKSLPHKNNVLRKWRHRWNKPPTLLQYRQVTRCIEISVRCRQQESGHRPSILEIINILGESESMDGHTGQESAYLDDDMLCIEPLELKLNEEMSWSVKLTNKTTASFAFNIERPSQQYTIWPDKGIVTPGCNEYLVQITLQPQQRAPQVTQNADKIIFQSTKVPEGLRDEDITENIFHEEAGKVVDEVDLMIVYEPTKPKENCKSREDTNMPAEEVPEAKRRKIVESAFGKGKLGSSEKAEAASMETETETLKGNLLRVKQRITDGERNGLIPTEEAEDWVQRAEQAISEEADNRESFDQRCRIFGCSLNYRGNYKTSKKAAEKVDAVRKYISSTPLPDNVTRTPPPPPVVDLSTHSVQLPPSRERILKNVLMCIKEDVVVGVIGIWGQDRDEKTHLLKKINDSFLGECPFDFVIFVTASSELSVQAQIISRLRTDTVPDVATQATRISELLKKKSFLLLVDDLRVQLDLQAVGIPHPLGDVEAVQRKVVVTSISQSICHLMDVERYIQVPDLEEYEARQLFTEEYGQQDPYSDPGIGALAEQLVRELKGLPSDLIRYGKVMQGIRDVRRWEGAIDAVRKANLQRDDPLNLAEKIVRSLKNATEDLDAKGNDVRREIVDAERQQRTPTNEGSVIEASAAELDDHNKIRRMRRALDSSDVELVKLMVMGEGLNLDEALALHYAVENCSREVVKALLELGAADVNHPAGPAGKTPLHVAAEMVCPDMVAVLLDHHADPNVRTVDGVTPLDILRTLTSDFLFKGAVPGLTHIEPNKLRLCLELVQSAAMVMSREDAAGNEQSTAMVMYSDHHPGAGGGGVYSGTGGTSTSMNLGLDNRMVYLNLGMDVMNHGDGGGNDGGNRSGQGGPSSLFSPHGFP